MLWKRVITAVVLLPLVLLALFKLPVQGVAILIGAAVMTATWELSALIGFRQPWQRMLFVATILVAGIFGSIWLLRGGNVTPVLGVACVWWIYAIVHIVREDGSYGGVFGSVAGRIMAGTLVIVPTWLGFLLLYSADQNAPSLLLYVLVLVWVADSLAYFTGRTWGRHKLAPKVSPGKSIEGVFGGLVGVVLFAYLAGRYFWDLRDMALLSWIMASLIAGAISVIGDLTESIFKRRAGVKDSGHLLPGHGGMFDRIDALTAAIPVFAFEWLLLQKIG